MMHNEDLLTRLSPDMHAADAVPLESATLGLETSV